MGMEEELGRMAGRGEGDRPYLELSPLDDGPAPELLTTDAGKAEKLGGGGEAATELEKEDLLEGGFIDDERLAREGVPGSDAVGVRGAPPAPSFDEDAPRAEWLSSPCSDAAEVMTESVSDAAVDPRRRKAGRVPAAIVEEEVDDEKEGVREWWISIF